MSHPRCQDIKFNSQLQQRKSQLCKMSPPKCEHVRFISQLQRRKLQVVKFSHQGCERVWLVYNFWFLMLYDRTNYSCGNYHAQGVNASNLLQLAMICVLEHPHLPLFIDIISPRLIFNSKLSDYFCPLMLKFSFIIVGQHAFLELLGEDWNPYVANGITQ